MEERILFKSWPINPNYVSAKWDPCAYFSLFKDSSLVCKSMEKYMRDFLWKGMEEGPSSHLVNWEVVGCPLS